MVTPPPVNPDLDRQKALIANGNLIVGANTDLYKCSISVFDPQPGHPNITIGDDCAIEGRIILHSNNARITIGNRVFIGSNALLFCYDSIEIGDDVMFSWDCTVIDTNAHSLRSAERKQDVLDWKKGPQFKDWSRVESQKVVIGPSCWLGFKSIVMKGVRLGDGCVVAAGSVVTKNFEPFSVIGGNPASFIKRTD
jgi:acetyltransferase-like isoleucine patch superfamily enzyme